jgi:predicted transcriptional regulator of viral defense system
LDHPEYCGGPSEVAKALVEAAKTVDWEKFVGYLEKMGNGAAFKRFGYLVELLGISVSNALMNRVIRRVTAGYSPLFSGAKLAGKRNAKWNLVLNASVSPIELLQ